MSSKKTNRTAVADENFAHVLPGPSNEELNRQQAEAEAKRAASGMPKVEFVADAHDKRIDGYGDLDYDPLGLTDPLAQLKKDHERPGMALKLLSPDVMNRIGSRGYQIVKDPDTGDPVRCGKQVLGEIPERHAMARRKAVADMSLDQLASIKDNQREKMERLKSEAKDLGLTVLDTGDKVQNIGDGQTYGMGITVDRGA